MKSYVDKFNTIEMLPSFVTSATVSVLPSGVIIFAICFWIIISPEIVVKPLQPCTAIKADLQSVSQLVHIDESAADSVFSKSEILVKSIAELLFAKLFDKLCKVICDKHGVRTLQTFMQFLLVKKHVKDQ